MFDRCRLVQTGLVGQQSYAVVVLYATSSRSAGRNEDQLFHTEPPAEIYPSHLDQSLC